MLKIKHLLFLILISMSCRTMAIFDCHYFPSMGPLQFTAPISGAVSVGEDAPVGTVLYRYVFTDAYQNAISCRDSDGTYSVPFTTTNVYRMLNVTLPRSDKSGTIQINGSTPSTIWETNVPGIGVALAIPPTHVESNYTWLPVNSVKYDTSMNANAEQPIWPNFNLFLVKTGDISPGVIQGMQIPSFEFDVDISPTTGDSPFRNAGRVTIAGSVTVTTMSCMTPDVTVPMGRYDVNTAFSGAGSATEWKDASIQLTNCPRSYGRRSWIQYSYSSNTTDMGNPTLNPFWLRLAAPDGAIDAANGIFNVSPGHDSAQGVGIQIALGSVSTPSSLQPISLNNAHFIDNFKTDGTKTYKIPLAARYIQTASSTSDIKPGKANGKLIFNIIYY